MEKILVINPGATSTKVALFHDTTEVFREEMRFDLEEMKKYKTNNDQLDDRYQQIVDSLEKHNQPVSELTAIVSRGGILPPVEAGAIEIDDAMVDYLLNKATVAHPANLGAAIAQKIMKQAPSAKGMIYDPISVDQFEPVARVSGLKGIERKSIGHILNMRAVAHQVAEKLNKPYEECDFVVVHAGSGVTMTAHKQGRMVDLLSDDEGPFSPERTGGLPLREVMDLCYTKSKEEVNRLHRNVGGLISYLDTNSLIEVEEMIREGNEEAKLLMDAFAYQIAKGIGTLSPVLHGKMDAIIITGGCAYSNMLMERVIPAVESIAPIELVPGEKELEALAQGGYRVLKGQEKASKLQL